MLPELRIHLFKQDRWGSHHKWTELNAGVNAQRLDSNLIRSHSQVGWDTFIYISVALSVQTCPGPHIKTTY